MQSCQSIISDQDRATFERDGYVIMRNVLSMRFIEDCRTATEIWIEAQIQEWIGAGLINHAFADLDFRTRFLAAWMAAGKPHYPRSPRKDCVDLAPALMMSILHHETLLDLAQGILDTDNVVSHGIFNLRPKAPEQRFTDTPWHQDAQYFPEYEQVNMVNMWFPMHDVDADSSCLAFSPQQHKMGLFENDESDIQNGFIGLTPERAQSMRCVPAELRAGDVVLFTNTTPHKAMSNKSELMRWSWDMRFIDLADADAETMKLGSIARHQDPKQICSLSEFQEKWNTAEW